MSETEREHNPNSLFMVWTPQAKVLERGGELGECTVTQAAAGPCGKCSKLLGAEVHMVADGDQGFFHPQCCPAKKHGQLKARKVKAG